MSTSDLIHIVPIYHSAWISHLSWTLAEISFYSEKGLTGKAFMKSLLLTTVIQNIFWTENCGFPSVEALGDSWWWQQIVFCHKTKIRGSWKSLKNAKDCFYFLIFILLKISSHSSSSRNNWSILLPLHCYFTHFLKLFRQYLFWVNRKWQFFSLAAESKHQILMWLC